MSEPFVRRFWPGKGKPGEPKLSKQDVVDMIESSLPSGIERLKELLVAKDTPTWAVIQIVDLLLNRAYGKPTQAITGADGGPIKISVDELRAKIEALAAEVPGEIGPPRTVHALSGVVDAELVESAPADSGAARVLQEADPAATGGSK